ncbi:hypothetical protein BB558_004511 [Smittium angustum]|uniref:F-box domain-containing protein n=1 Tax=Smittium angustum TaxID=133377 RepID=A0A2U1J302_SMIAN|nr:hypothetical protein BB558_004511 [Smittium angustum]
MDNENQENPNTNSNLYSESIQPLKKTSNSAENDLSSRLSEKNIQDNKFESNYSKINHDTTHLPNYKGKGRMTDFVDPAKNNEKRYEHRDSICSDSDYTSSYQRMRSVSVSSISSTASSFVSINTDVLDMVFKLLSPNDLKNVVLVCRRWKYIASAHLWRRMIFPIEKRKLAAMRHILVSYGQFVQSAMVTPPIGMLTVTASSSGGMNIPVVGSYTKNNQWSLPKPLSRSGSVSSASGSINYSSYNPFAKTGSTSKPNRQLIGSSSEFGIGCDKETPRMFFLNSEENLNHSSAAKVNKQMPIFEDTQHSSPLTSFAYTSDSDSAPIEGNNNFNQRGLMSSRDYFSRNRNYSNQHLNNFGDSYQHTDARMSLDTHPSEPESISSTPVQSPFPAMAGVAIPIPGTPGVGNMLESNQNSPVSSYSISNAHNSFNSHTGSIQGGANSVGGIGGNFALQGATHNHIGKFPNVSSSTISKLQQFMECYCPYINDLTVLNPNGITSHSRRIELLEKLFTTYPNLLHLNLTDFIMWDVEAMRLVSLHLHNLRSLNVSNRVELRDDDLVPVIENCLLLEQLHLRATNISDQTILAIEQNLRNRISVLDIGGCSISAKAMSSLIQKTRNLKELRAWSCLRLNDEFLTSLNPNLLKNLEILDLMDINSFSESAVLEAFTKQQWPSLRYLRIRVKCSPSAFVGLSPRAVLKLNPTSILD